MQGDGAQQGDGGGAGAARGPIPRWIARPLMPLYRAVIARRNRRFDARLGVVELDRPVVSVGNLTVGGTGKTPMVAWLIALLRGAGRDPAVAMRGYRAGPRGSDEALEYASEFSGLPLVAQADRLSGLLGLFASDRGERVDVVVLDDGFQHRRIARQLDIVLVDATRSPFEGELLPAGWLREPVESLARAGAVVITHAGRVSDASLATLRERVRGAAPGAVLAECTHVWRGLRLHSRSGAGAGEGADEVPVSWLRGGRVVACCAIGNPGPFLAGVREQGAEVRELVLRDHDPFGPGTVRRLAEMAREHGARGIVVTSKDWVKLRRYSPGVWPCPVVVPRLGLEFGEGREGLERAALEAAAMDLGRGESGAGAA